MLDCWNYDMDCIQMMIWTWTSIILLDHKIFMRFELTWLDELWFHAWVTLIMIHMLFYAWLCMNLFNYDVLNLNFMSHVILPLLIIWSCRTIILYENLIMYMSLIMNVDMNWVWVYGHELDWTWIDEYELSMCTSMVWFDYDIDHDFNMSMKVTWLWMWYASKYDWMFSIMYGLICIDENRYNLPLHYHEHGYHGS